LVASSYSNRATVDLQEPGLGDILKDSSYEIFNLPLVLPPLAAPTRRDLEPFRLTTSHSPLREL
jgi:hypothetical protein